MNWDIWTKVEQILLELKLSPIVAVVPDNQDPDLRVAPAHPDFWREVRKWQTRGWTVGLHGYQHKFITREAGIVGLAPRSEFAGLSAKEQQAKLRHATEIFRREGVTPEVWVAPLHSFDQVTLLALRQLGLQVVSDGFALAPHRDSNGLLWIPQQLWEFRWRPFGVWTVCQHHNRWTPKDIASFRTAVQKYRGRISDLRSVVELYSQRHYQVFDELYAGAHMATRLLRRQIPPSA
jgi:predicted deacetylase